jgi:hypothetical protein
MLDDRSPTTHVSDTFQPLDKSATLAQIEELDRLPLDWNGYGASPIDPKTLESAARFVESLPLGEISAPQVVPMTRGRLQLEWHRGHRSLELEFETPTLIHYLKFDQDQGIEEEAMLPVDEMSRLLVLLHWFHEE